MKTLKYFFKNILKLILQTCFKKTWSKIKISTKIYRSDGLVDFKEYEYGLSEIKVTIVGLLFQKFPIKF